jgi:hypothetical protein
MPSHVRKATFLQEHLAASQVIGFASKRRDLEHVTFDFTT